MAGSAYDDLPDVIPGPARRQRRPSAYDDLPQVGTPAPGPAAPAAVEPAVPAADAPRPGILERIKDVLFKSAPKPMLELPAESLPKMPAAIKDVPASDWFGPEGYVTNAPAMGATSLKGAFNRFRQLQLEDTNRKRMEALGYVFPEKDRVPDELLGGTVEIPPVQVRDPLATMPPWPLRSQLESYRRTLPRRLAIVAEAKRSAEEAERDEQLVTPQGEPTILQKAFASTVKSLPSLLMAAVTGILTKSPGAAMAVGGGLGAAQQGGSTYGEALKATGEHSVASRAAKLDMITEFIGEATPIGIAFKAGTPMARRVVNTMIAEAIQEGAVTQPLQDLNAKLSYNPKLTLEQALENMAVAGLAGPMAGGPLAVASHATASKFERQMEAARGDPAKERATVLAHELERAVNESRWAKSAEEVAAAGPAAARVQVVPPLFPNGEVPNAARARIQPVGDQPEHPQEQLVPAARSTEAVEEDELAEEALGSPDEPIKMKHVSIDEVLKLAQQPGTAAGQQAWSTYRTVDEAESKLIKDQTGLDVAGYYHHVDDSAVRHVLERHGAEATETSRAQLPIMPEDIKLLPQLTDPSKAFVQLGPKTKRGALDTLEYHRQIGDNYYVVEEVRTGRKRLALLTMRKTRAALDAPEPGAPAHTSETFGAQSDDSVRPDDGGGKGPKNLGMPASTPIAPPVSGVPRPPAAAAAEGGKARPDAIRRELAKLFETVISERYQGNKNLGIYRVKPQTIRVRNVNDLRTIAHEVGHHISERNQPFRMVMRQPAHAAELIAMMPLAYKQAIAKGRQMSKKLQIEEGFAEFLANYLMNRAAARTGAPQFFRAFESWLYTNPRYLAAVNQVADHVGEWQQLSPEDRIMAKVGAAKPPFGERVREALSADTWNTFVHSTLDKWDPMRRMVADLAPAGIAPSKNPYIWARFLGGDAAIIEDWISYFTSPYDYAKRADPKNYGKPLKEVLDPVLGDKETATKFKAYLIARRAAELKKVGKENLFTPQEIADGLSLETPEFRKVAEEVYAYNERLVDYAVEGGLLSSEVAKAFKMYEAYIPFFREADEEGGRPGGKGAPFKKLSGGTANIGDPIANLIQNTANIIHAVNRNAVIQKAVKLATGMPGGGRWIETVPPPKQAIELSTDRIIEQLEGEGVMVDRSTAQNLAAIQTFFTPSGKGDDRHRTIVYKEGGVLKAAQINDPLLWKTMSNMPPLELGMVGDALAFVARLMRTGVVLDPTFMIRNGIRDTLSATMQSRGTFIPVVSTAHGMVDAVKQQYYQVAKTKLSDQMNDAYKMMRAYGGGFSDQFKEPEEAAKAIERMAKRGNFDPITIISPARWMQILRGAGAVLESASRIGEFKATVKPGDVESVIQGTFNAREVSTDFGMRGQNPYVQALTRITPFLNPAMQGMYKTARVLSTADGKELAAKAWMVGSAMAIASVTLALLNADKDWYKRLEEWEKAAYWHFDFGIKDERGNDIIIRIPKPFEYGAIFASIPEAIALLQQGKEDWPDFKKRMLQVLAQFTLRVVPQAALVPVEPWANKSLFTGRPIVPMKQKNLEPGLQSNPNTSKTAKLVGEAANVPPAWIDNVVRNVFGTLGVHTMTGIDVLLQKSGVVPEGRERSWASWPGVKALVHDPENPNSKQMRDFYDELEKYRTAVGSLRDLKERGEHDKAVAYEQDKQAELELAKRAEKTAKKLAKWRNDAARIERDRELTPAEKRDQINEINRSMQHEVEGMQEEARGTRLYLKARESYKAQQESRR